MAKKSFGMGVDAIFSGASARKERVLVEYTNHDEEKLKNNNKDYVKVCCQFNQDVFAKFKAVAHWERLSHRQLLDKVLKLHFAERGEEYVDKAISSFNKFQESEF